MDVISVFVHLFGSHVFNTWVRWSYHSHSISQDWVTPLAKSVRMFVPWWSPSRSNLVRWRHVSITHLIKHRQFPASRVHFSGSTLNIFVFLFISVKKQNKTKILNSLTPQLSPTESASQKTHSLRHWSAKNPTTVFPGEQHVQNELSKTLRAAHLWVCVFVWVFALASVLALYR